jgi:hypothetical protein
VAQLLHPVDENPDGADVVGALAPFVHNVGRVLGRQGIVEIDRFVDALLDRAVDFGADLLRQGEEADASQRAASSLRSVSLKSA